jgi:cation diffusion facilitator family transporter
MLASVAVIGGGINGLWHGVALERLGWGLAIAAGLALVNLALAATLIRVGRQERSELLVANGFHVLADVLTTAAAGVGLTLVVATDVSWLDPLAALCIGGFILASGVALVRKAVAGLMDELDPTVSKPVIECLQAACERDQIRGFHQLKCRSLGDELWIAVHVQVPDALTVVEAHERATRLEREVRGLFPGKTVNMLSHVEPEDHAATHPRDHEPAFDPLTHQTSNGGLAGDGTPTHGGSMRHDHKD